MPGAHPCHKQILPPDLAKPRFSAIKHHDKDCIEVRLPLALVCYLLRNRLLELLSVVTKYSLPKFHPLGFSSTVLTCLVSESLNLLTALFTQSAENCTVLSSLF